jgi:hypothetical protein
MAFGCGNFHPGNDQKSVHRLPILAQIPFVPEIPATVGGVVVGQGKAMKAALFSGGD